MVTHAPAGRHVLRHHPQGRRRRSRRDNVEYTYSNDGDPTRQAVLIENAVNTRPDGILVSVPAPEALQAGDPEGRRRRDPGRRLQRRPRGRLQGLGRADVLRPGRGRRRRGRRRRLKRERRARSLCVIHEQGHVGLEARCDGVKQGFGGTVENLYVNGTDMTAVRSTIESKLQQDPSIDPRRHPRRALRADRRPGEAERRQQGQDRHLRPQRGARRQDRVDGEVPAPSTSSPTCRATWPSTSLWLYQRNGNVLGGGQAVLTGPAFIDKDNVETSPKFAQARHPLTAARAAASPRRADIDGGAHHGQTPLRRRPAGRRAARAQSLRPRCSAGPRSAPLVGAIAIFVCSSSSRRRFRQPAVAGDRAVPGLHHRHHGRPRRAADDRRRVRPVRRCRGDHLGADRRPCSRYQLSVNVWVGVGWSRCSSRWRSGSLNGYLLIEDETAQLHRHARHVPHADRAEPGRHQAHHRQVATKIISDMDGFDSARRRLRLRVQRRRRRRSRSRSSGGSPLVPLATWVLLRTRFGNWIFAVGGDDAARPRGRRPGQAGPRSACSWASAFVRLVPRHAHPVLVQHRAVRRGRAATSSSTSSRPSSAAACSPAATARRSAPRIGAFIFGMTEQGHRATPVEPRLVQVLPRRDAPAAPPCSTSCVRKTAETSEMTTDVDSETPPPLVTS